MSHHATSNRLNTADTVTSVVEPELKMSKAPGNAPVNGGPGEKSYFEQQRSLLLSDIGESLEHVLQNTNKLNRSLEGVIAVGNEFSAVEALWSHFENVRAKEPEAEDGDKTVVGKDEMETPGKDSSATKR